MTVTGEASATGLSGQVAGEIRAWMGRLRVRQSELARRLGQNDEWLSKRLQGITPINLNEMQRIATALGVGVRDLLPRDGDEVRLPVSSPARTRRDPLTPAVIATAGQPRTRRPHAPIPAQRATHESRRRAVRSTRPISPMPV